MPRVGLWGAYDRENYGDVLFPRIARMMLQPRVPGLELRVFAPLGYPGRNRFDDGTEPSEPLGAWTPERIEELAEQLDALIIGGGEIVHDRHFELAADYGLGAGEMERYQPFRYLVEGLGEHEADVPTAWHGVGVPFAFDDAGAERIRRAVRHRAFLTVRDELSRDKLVAAGVEQEVAVVPDSVYAIEALLPRPLLDDRLRRMRERGTFPEGDVLVLQGSRSLLDQADTIADQVARLCRRLGLVPLLAEIGPIHGDGAFADALSERLPGAVRLAPDTGLVDLTAALAASAGFIGSSLHGNVVAAAYDRPSLLVDLAGLAKLEGQAIMLDAPERHVVDARELVAAFVRVARRGSIAHHIDHLRRRLDEHFDRLAELCRSAPDRPHPPAPPPPAVIVEPKSEGERLARANAALAEQLSAQQASFADRERDLRERLDAVIQEGEEAVVSDRATIAELGDLVGRLKEEVAWAQGVREEREAELETLRSDHEDLRHRYTHMPFRTWIRLSRFGRAAARIAGRRG